MLTGLDYADDISLFSNHMEQAQELLSSVESECTKVGLQLNAKKTYTIQKFTFDYNRRDCSEGSQGLQVTGRMGQLN